MSAEVKKTVLGTRDWGLVENQERARSGVRVVAVGMSDSSTVLFRVPSPEFRVPELFA
jgi:hypothetical protein